MDHPDKRESEISISSKKTTSMEHHFECLPSNITSDGPRFAVKFGQESWPFPMIVRTGSLGTDHHYRTYKPKNSFLVLKSGLPRVAVEVNSRPLDQPAADHHRLVLHGASIVRFANAFLDAYQEQRDFVFVAIFIGDTGLADRYFLYQREGSRKGLWQEANLQPLKQRGPR
ncbi:hypothetical protein EDB87DRAFT_1015282 [Lactarius vividus]|nr:hypothetical protein EDB87DRAFT_1015282 [Lactarius vividus]